MPQCTPSKTIKKLNLKKDFKANKKGISESLVVECLHSMCKDLGLISSIIKEKELEGNRDNVGNRETSHTQHMHSHKISLERKERRYIHGVKIIKK
jgi:hypothetical protein